MAYLSKKPTKISSMQNDNEKDKVVQTYAQDVAEVIENDKGGGLIKKIIHGEEEHEIEKRRLSPESKRNRLFMFVSFLLLFFTLIILSSLFFKKDADTVAVEKQFAPIIFNDKTIFLEVAGLNKDEISQTVSNEVSGTGVKLGGIEGIYLTENKKIIGLRKFIALIKSDFTVNQSDPNFVNDNFLLGVVNNGNLPASSAGKDFFMLIKMRTLPDIFNSLRVWENKMFSDLHGFFGIGIGSGTKYLLTKEFQNGIIQNKNARILYDQYNKIVIMYILANDTSVIITNTENAAREIMLRLASSQIKK